MRDIGFAYKETNPYTEKTSMQETESDLIFMGICAIEDPAREEVPAAIKAAYDAKIKIIMITGDYGSTAEAIGHNIGLDQNGKLLVIPGEDLKKLDNIQLLKIIKKQNALIFSRAAPEDKLRIVSLIKEAGYVVAVT
jgi:magnesium-transporting ATPase (P-type)